MARPSEVNGALVTDCGLLRECDCCKAIRIPEEPRKTKLQWTRKDARHHVIFVCFGDLRLVEAAGFQSF